jgi:hypothetical protein
MFVRNRRQGSSKNFAVLTDCSVADDDTLDGLHDDDGFGRKSVARETAAFGKTAAQTD